MSAFPSPVQSPGPSNAVKLCQPEPIFSAVPVAKPPKPSPRYMSSAPSDCRASRSGRPSPLKSPELNTAVNAPQPAPIGSPVAVAKPPVPVPRYCSSRPSGPTARTSPFPSPLQSARAAGARSSPSTSSAGAMSRPTTARKITPRLERDGALALPGRQLEQRLLGHVARREDAGVAVAPPRDDGAVAVGERPERDAVDRRLLALGPRERLAADDRVGDVATLLAVEHGPGVAALDVVGARAVGLPPELALEVGEADLLDAVA